jgi:Pyruvate/2-oxoacid:ferredoxin oxidoreductase gamma subunit
LGGKNMIPAFPLRVFKDRSKDEMLCAARPEPAVDVRQLFPSTSVQTASIPKGAIARGEAQAAALKISGFGGQGVLFLGIALAEAGIREGLQVSWIPSYGPEMRGGTAHCHVRLSRESIASPLVDTPSVVMAFNEPSMERFRAELAPGGLLLANSSMGQKAAVRPDINVLWIPATEAAKDLGNPRVANMVMLGAYVETTRVVAPESILASLDAHGMGADLLRQNRLALLIWTRARLVDLAWRYLGRLGRYATGSLKVPPVSSPSMSCAGSQIPETLGQDTTDARDFAIV